MAGDSPPYADFIEGELVAETERRRLLDQRSASAATVSFTLATLAVGVSTFLLGKDFKPAQPAAVLLGAALTALVVAAGCSVLAGISKPFVVVSSDTLFSMIDEHYHDSVGQQRYAVAWCRIMTLEKLRTGNRIKERWLIAAQGGALGTIALFAAFIWTAVAS